MAPGGPPAALLSAAVWFSVLYSQGYGAEAPGYVDFGNGYGVWVDYELLQFYDARAVCQEEGDEIAYIDGLTFKNDLSNPVSLHISQRLSGCAWIGMTKASGTWKWLNGVTVIQSQLTWAPKVPGDRNFLCGSVCWQNLEWTWKKQPCDATLPVICAYILGTYRPRTTPTLTSATDSQPSTTDSQPSTTDSQPSTTDSQPSTTDSQPSTTDVQPSTTGARPSTTNFHPSATDVQPSTAGVEPSTTNVQELQGPVMNGTGCAENVEVTCTKKMDAVYATEQGLFDTHVSSLTSCVRVCYGKCGAVNYNTRTGQCRGFGQNADDIGRVLRMGWDLWGLRIPTTCVRLWRNLLKKPSYWRCEEVEERKETQVDRASRQASDKPRSFLRGTPEGG